MQFDRTALYFFAGIQQGNESEWQTTIEQGQANDARNPHKGSAFFWQVPTRPTRAGSAPCRPPEYLLAPADLHIGSAGMHFPGMVARDCGCSQWQASLAVSRPGASRYKAPTEQLQASTTRESASHSTSEAPGSIRVTPQPPRTLRNNAGASREARRPRCVALSNRVGRVSMALLGCWWFDHFAIATFLLRAYLFRATALGDLDGQDRPATLRTRLRDRRIPRGVGALRIGVHE